MSTQDKLRAMEGLWDDLVREPETVPVPDWHRVELMQRANRAKDEEAEFSEWDTVKRRLRDYAR